MKRLLPDREYVRRVLENYVADGWVRGQAVQAWERCQSDKREREVQVRKGQRKRKAG